MDPPAITRRYAATRRLRIAAPGISPEGTTRSPGHRFRRCPGGRRPGVRSGQVHQPELAQQAEFVKAPPALHDPAAADAPDIDPGKGDGMAGRWHAEDFAPLRAAGGKVLHHQVAL